MMGGGSEGTPSIKPGSGQMSKLWYVVCNNGTVEIVKENDIGDSEELYTPFETRREATEWVNQNYPDKKC